MKKPTMNGKESTFRLVSTFVPKGDQPKAIEKLIKNFNRGKKKQTLLGVTGSGKTFTVAHVIADQQLPTLVLAHNKTLAGQLYHELKVLFPQNRVEYFVSYYDYYQPEAYVAKTDTYIEKDLQINPKLEQMRLSATQALLTRSDVIIVASVSCIFGLGDPKTYESLAYELRVGAKQKRQDIIRKIVEQQYERSDELLPGNYRVKGSTIDIVPGYQDDVLRIELFGDEIDKMTWLDKYNLTAKETVDYYYLFPARHFVMPDDERAAAVNAIRKELAEVLPTIDDPLIAHRLKTRVEYDLELIEEVGFCKGIENYSRHFEKRKAGSAPSCLLDYFPDKFLMIIDESHQTLPQLRGMYKGDRSRKESLVNYGFRLPCALDNRPLRFEECEKYMRQVVFVSATPSEYERDNSLIVEQIIRPTGLVDPVIETHSIEGQIDHLIAEVKAVTAKGYRTLVTTLTKRMAEELTEYLANAGIKVRYLHSDIDTLERTEILRQLRAGDFDVLVGINLLREGIDVPEVALVAILDADKEGFLRNETSLIQIIGRAARNEHARVIMYMDTMTDSIRRSMVETNRRRSLQLAYNKHHGITPHTVSKPVPVSSIIVKDIKHIPKKDRPKVVSELQKAMVKAADNLDFEAAIMYRDQIEKLKK